MKRQIIFFLSQPIDESNKRRFGYYDLSKYFNFQIWDISSLFFKNNEIFKDKILNDEKNFFFVKNIFDLLKKAAQIENGFLFSDLTTGKSLMFSLLQLYFKFIKKGCKFHISVRNEPDIVFLSRKKKILLLLKTTLPFFFKTLFQFFKNKICNLIIPNPSIAFLCGQKDKMRNINKCKLIETFSFDFATNLSTKKENFSEFKNFFVYIDQMMFCHPDEIRYGSYAPFVNKNSILNNAKKGIFYNELRYFFNFIINVYKIKIVISVHPKATIKNINFIKSIFHGDSFYIAQNNTSALVKSSLATICHHSASIEFAVLNYKPIIFCYSQQFSDSEKKAVLSRSEILSLKAIDISKKHFDLSLSFNKIFYDDYIFNYISKFKTNSQKYWDIIIKNLKYS